MSDDFINKELVKGKLQALWDGNVPLVQTFWLYYFITVALLNIFSSVGGMPGMILRFAALCWTGFMVKPILIAADKYSGPAIYALLAKIAAILIMIGVICRFITGV